MTSAAQPKSLPRFEQMLETLVQTPSVSCTNAQYDRSNIEVINHLANWLADMGFDTQVQEVPETPGKANLIATAGQQSSDDPSTPATGLVLAGHTDTVPVSYTHLTLPTIYSV